MPRSQSALGNTAAHFRWSDTCSALLRRISVAYADSPAARCERDGREAGPAGPAAGCCARGYLRDGKRQPRRDLHSCCDAPPPWLAKRRGFGLQGKRASVDQTGCRVRGARCAGGEERDASLLMRRALVSCFGGVRGCRPGRH